MAKEPKLAATAAVVPEGKRSKVSQSDFPIYSLDQAIRIAQGLWDDFAGKDAEPHQLALSLDQSPTSGSWRNLCGSAIAYGLTNGGYGAGSIGLTELGRRIVSPLHEGDDDAALKEACLKPRIMAEFFRRYDKAKLPKDEIAKNVLITLGLPKERASAALETIKRNGEKYGVILQTKTGPFVTLSGAGAGGGAVPRTSDDADEDEPDVIGTSGREAASSAPAVPAPAIPKGPTPGPKQLFVAHGKNMKPVDELRKILDQFKIPYKIAVDEAHSGRPISSKVAELMKSCSAGIFVFTKDEQFTNSQGQEIWRPSENAIYELGAGNILWDSKIIVLKEDGVNFASDYQDIGYINFGSGGVSAKALDLLKELVALGLVQFQAT